MSHFKIISSSLFIKIGLVTVLSFSNSCSSHQPVSLESIHKTKVWILEHNPQVEHPLLVELFDQLFLRLREGYLNLNIEVPENIKIIVIENPKVGVFSLCDGSIFISTGTILGLKSAHQLISLLAHDISHVQLTHACAYTEKSGEIMDFEIEADEQAIKVLTASHIDPFELKNVYLSVYRQSEKIESEDATTMNSERLANIEEAIENVPEIPTKIPQERLFRKVQHLLSNLK